MVTAGGTKRKPKSYNTSWFVDAKMGGIYLRRSLYYYEAVGYIDVLSRSPYARAGGLPLMVYITTSDVKISKSLVDVFTKNNVLFAQMYMVYDPITKLFYLTDQIILNPGVQKLPTLSSPPVPLPQPQFRCNWNLLKPF